MAEPKEQLPRSTVASVGEVTKKGDFFKALVEMADGKSGWRWLKDEKGFAELKKWKEEGTEVEYNWTAPTEKSESKIQVFAIKTDEAKSKDTGKRKSEFTKDKEAKDSYWEKKFEYEVQRQTINDKKIELQHYQNLVAGLVKSLITPDTTTEEMTGYLKYVSSAAKVLYKENNPTEQA